MAVPLSTLHPDTLEFDAAVLHVTDEGGVELDQTYFYATSGGQPNDTGIIKRNDEEFKILDVRKKDGHVLHILDRTGLESGDKVHCVIDEARRAKLRRMHTATHVLCAVLEKTDGAVVTGNQIGEERTRVDFKLDNFDVARIPFYFEEANRIIASGAPVRRYVTTREELMKDPSLVKLAMGFPEDVTDVHMVEIEGYDLQPCGGTHADGLEGIGTLVFEKTESKGKSNRRISFTLS
jgi:Ser-tRNA(Ala) deacylase AlaX